MTRPLASGYAAAVPAAVGPATDPGGERVARGRALLRAWHAAEGAIERHPRGGEARVRAVVRAEAARLAWLEVRAALTDAEVEEVRS